MSKTITLIFLSACSRELMDTESYLAGSVSFCARQQAQFHTES